MRAGTALSFFFALPLAWGHHQRGLINLLGKNHTLLGVSEDTKAKAEVYDNCLHENQYASTSLAAERRSDVHLVRQSVGTMGRECRHR